MESETNGPVQYQRQGPTAIISLNRPEVRNAQNTAMTVALDAAFTEFAMDDDARVAILRANGVPLGKADYLGPFMEGIVPEHH